MIRITSWNDPRIRAGTLLMRWWPEHVGETMTLFVVLGKELLDATWYWRLLSHEGVERRAVWMSIGDHVSFEVLA